MSKENKSILISAIIFIAVAAVLIIINMVRLNKIDQQKKELEAEYRASWIGEGPDERSLKVMEAWGKEGLSGFIKPQYLDLENCTMEEVEDAMVERGGYAPDSLEYKLIKGTDDPAEQLDIRTIDLKEFNEALEKVEGTYAELVYDKNEVNVINQTEDCRRGLDLKVKFRDATTIK